MRRAERSAGARSIGRRGGSGRGQEEDRLQGRLARVPRAAVGAPAAADDRPDVDDVQPPGGHRAAGAVQVRDRRCDRQGAGRAADADRAGGRRRDGRPGGDELRPVADSRRGRAARHHRHAQARPGEDHAPAGPLFRLDAERRAAVAHHERRRRHPQPGRHRPGAAGGRRPHRDHQPRRAAVSQLADDARHRAGPGGVRRRHGLRVQAAAAVVPRARQDPGGSDRPAHRSARRHPHRQELHGGEARRDRVHARRAQAVPQHRAVDDRRLGHDLRQHRDHRRRRRDHDLDGRQRHPRRPHDAGRFRDVHLLHRPAGGADDLDRQHRHADHRSVCRARSHPRDPEHGDRGRSRRGQALAGRDPRRDRASRTSGSNTTRASRS